MYYQKTGWAIGGTQENFHFRILLPYNYDDRHYCSGCKTVYLDHATKVEINEPLHGTSGEWFYKCGGKLHPASNVLKIYHANCGWLDQGVINWGGFQRPLSDEDDFQIFYTPLLKCTSYPAKATEHSPFSGGEGGQLFRLVPVAHKQRGL